MYATNRSKIYIALSVLVLAALACQANFNWPPASAAALPASDSVISSESSSNGGVTTTVSEAPTLVSAVNPPVTVDLDLSVQEEALTTLYERVSPGVVALLVASDTSAASGSGFVIDMDGHIVTNFHVVEGATEIQVNFPSGVKTRGEVIGTDTDSDIAIVKVDVDPKWLHPVALGDSSDLKVGQIVVAIGNPFGLNSTMTTGIISSLGRTLESINTAESGQTFTAGGIIQTDAAINPGNSGGPLLNLNGEVIGINRAIRTFSVTDSNEPANSGIGFAISVNILKRVAPALIADGDYEYPYLGISSMPEMPLEIAEELGLERAIGSVVTSIVSGGPGNAAGLEVGDVILEINDEEVFTFGNLIAYLFTETSAGDTVNLTVLRDGEMIQIDLVLGARP
jgi:2-alkenal reductase